MTVQEYKTKLLQVAVGDEVLNIHVDESIGSPLKIYKLSDFAEDEQRKIEERCEKAYAEDVPMLFHCLMELRSVYTAETYSKANRQRDHLQRFFGLFEGPHNKKREFADGQTVYQYTEGLLSISARFHRVELDLASRLKSLSSSASYEFAEMLLLSTMGELANVFRQSEQWYRKYVEELTAVLYHSNLTKLERLSPRPPELPAYLINDLLPASESKLTLDNEEGMRFSELYSCFLKHKVETVNLSLKMQSEYNDYSKTILHALGDVSIATITRKQIRDFLATYAMLPKRNLVAYKNRPIGELWGGVVPEKDRIATRTMLSVKKFLLGVFRFAIDQEYLAVSPVADLNQKIKLEKKRGPFTDSEVKQIFATLEPAAAVTTKPWQKWVVLFGAYTGARAGEIVDLLKDDIKLEDGIWSVVVRGTKTANALRKFPLAPELIDKGFLNFVGGGEGRVFPIEVTSKKVTAFFPRVLAKAGVPKQNTRNLDRSFHSFRHTVITKARGANFDEALIQQIVGHERTGAGVTDTYTHDFTAKQLLPVVEAITY